MRSVTSGYMDALGITTKDDTIFQKVTSPKVDMNRFYESNDSPPCSHGRAPAVDGEFGAMNETGPIRRQKDNGLRNLVRGRRTARWRLGGQLLKPLPHGLCAFGARRPRTHGIDADPARAIFRRPCFGQQVDGGLA